MLNKYDFSYTFLGDNMLKTKAIRKIFITTLFLFTKLTVLSISTINNNKTLSTN